ncbi:GH3 auxin-responsive promoter family protein, partial [Chloroflexota bacterium]
MLSEDKFFQTRDTNEIWKRYCGFLDLSITDFMETQRYLLLDQIDLIADSPLGRKIMNGQKPKTVAEFRHKVPLTTYDDYTPYLTDKDDDALAIKPYYWIHTSGTGGSPKWVPMSKGAAEVGWKRNSLAFFILCAAKKKGDVCLKPGARLIIHTPPRPYGSAQSVYDLTNYFILRTIPPVSEADSMTFPEKIEKSFKMAMRDGADFVCSTSAVLIRMGEDFRKRSSSTKFSLSMLHPSVLFRFARAWLYSKLQKRPMLPKDLWPAKGILCWGAETSIYKDKILYHWGKIPYEF